MQSPPDMDMASEIGWLVGWVLAPPSQAQRRSAPARPQQASQKRKTGLVCLAWSACLSPKQGGEKAAEEKKRKEKTGHPAQTHDGRIRANSHCRLPNRFMECDCWLRCAGACVVDGWGGWWLARRVFPPLWPCLLGGVVVDRRRGTTVTLRLPNENASSLQPTTGGEEMAAHPPFMQAEQARQHHHHHHDEMCCLHPVYLGTLGATCLEWTSLCKPNQAHHHHHELFVAVCIPSMPVYLDTGRNHVHCASLAEGGGQRSKVLQGRLQRFPPCETNNHVVCEG